MSLYNTVIIKIPYYSRIILNIFYNRLAFPKLFQHNGHFPNHIIIKHYNRTLLNCHNGKSSVYKAPLLLTAIVPLNIII